MPFDPNDDWNSVAEEAFQADRDRPKVKMKAFAAIVDTLPDLIDRDAVRASFAKGVQAQHKVKLDRAPTKELFQLSQDLGFDITDSPNLTPLFYKIADSTGGAFKTMVDTLTAGKINVQIEAFEHPQIGRSVEMILELIRDPE